MTRLSFYIKFVLFNLFFIANSVKADDKTCQTLNEIVSDGVGDKFLLTPAFDTIVKAAASLATSIWNQFATTLQGIVVLGAAIYIAVFTLKNIGSFSQQDTAGYLSNEKTGVIPLMFKVAVVVILLTDAGNTFLYKDLISPVISTAMSVGSNFGGGISGNFGGASDVGGLFESVITKAKEFNEDSYIIVAIGRLLMCLAFLPESFIDTYWSLLPFGFVLYAFGWLICIGIAFYMLDVLFRLAVACILLPFAIACSVSKLTSNYTQKTWYLFVNVCFNFMVLGFLIGFSVMVIANAMTGSEDLYNDLAANSNFTESQVEKIAETLSLKSFILTFVCCMMIFRLFTEIENIADAIVGQKSSVGKMAQTTSAPIVKGAMTVATAPISAIGKAAVQEAGSSIKNSKAGRAVRRAGANFKRGVKDFFGLKD